MVGQLSATYNPAHRCDVLVKDIEYLHRQHESWPARIYQPVGKGPFPAIVDVHGGAWNNGRYLNNATMDQALAASGIVVAAVEFRQAPEHAYPGQVADVNYAIRWLKAHAADFNADPASVGGLGSSSGGHTIILSAMRPHDRRYACRVLEGETQPDATMLFTIGAWPVIDPYARYLYAQKARREGLVRSTEAYFLSEATMREGNPQHILERGEKAEMPPILIVQGTNDDNVPMSIPENFVKAFRAAGGRVELELFPGMPHGFGNTPGPESGRAIELMKSFVARQVTKAAAAV